MNEAICHNTFKIHVLCTTYFSMSINSLSPKSAARHDACLSISNIGTSMWFL